MRVPLLRPLLPSAEDLLPYLRRIDQNRIYSNWGPLVTELSERLSGFFSVSSERIVTASSGTAALVGGILATAGRATGDRSIAITQAMTFVGTFSAIEQCGYTAHIMDVDRERWSLVPDAVRDLPDLNKVGVVVPVAPYGRPIETRPWERFASETGIPVVIDAAACFDTLGMSPKNFIGTIPIALSFHATKVFSTGEGGCVICPDGGVAERVLGALNFGFSRDRNSRGPSINGKMNEYNAAIGLCSLDRWNATENALREVFEFYTDAFAGVPHCRLILWPRISGAYAILFCEELSPHYVTAELEFSDIDYRFWYGRGLQSQEYVKRQLGESRLPVSEYLCSRLIGLPIALDWRPGEKDTLRSLASQLINIRASVG